MECKANGLPNTELVSNDKIKVRELCLRVGLRRDDAALKVHIVYSTCYVCKENILLTLCFPLRLWIVEGIVNKYWITGCFIHT